MEGPDEDFELTDEDVAIIEQALEVEEDALSIPTDLAAAVAVRAAGDIRPPPHGDSTAGTQLLRQLPPQQRSWTILERCMGAA